MSLFSNDIRVANTATPSFQQQANVGQFGWTGADQGHYNQLIQYVDECRKIWLGLEDKIEYIDNLLKDIANIDEQVKYVTQKSNEVAEDARQTAVDVARTAVMYNQSKALYDSFEADYSDFSPKYNDFFTKYPVTVEAAVNAKASEVGAKEWYDKSKDLYDDLKEGQVYRGTWNPKTNAYPDNGGTNSVWDVILDDGVTSVDFGGFTWRSGDRLLYVVSSNSYDRLATGSGVTSVNGEVGAVTLTADKVGALGKTENAVSATKLKTSRKISGVDFDGTSDIVLGPTEVNSVPLDRKINDKFLDSDITLTATDVGAEVSGTALGLVQKHEEKTSAHPISGVEGLSNALSSKYSPTNKPSTSDVTGLDEALKNAGGSPVLSTAWVQLRTAMWNGYVAADGQLLKRADYPDAWAAIESGKVPVTSDAAWLADASRRGCFTTGDGSTTFRVPDYNGKSDGSLGAAFLRGDGLNSAGVEGRIQFDAIREMAGEFFAAPYNDGANTSIVWKPSGVFSITKQAVDGSKVSALNYASSGWQSKVSFRASDSAPTAADNHPVNATGCWAIKLFGAVQNAGSIDAMGLATQVANLDSNKLDKASVVAPMANGGVIESGSNANGEFIKFADGTLICTAIKESSAAGPTTWTYPSSFFDGSVHTKQISQNGSSTTNNMLAGKFQAGTGTSTPFMLMQTLGSVSPVGGSCCLFASGKWK